MLNLFDHHKASEIPNKNNEKRYNPALIEKLKPMLNSERIKCLFGSYEVEVMYQDDQLRVSNLHSLEDNIQTMRTCAIVHYSLPIHEELTTAHGEIIKGSSLGTTLKKHGFNITKEPLYFGEGILPEFAQQQMKVDTNSCAIHIYRLHVSNKNIKNLEYCSIIEAHSPKYLTANELNALYPDQYSSNNTITPEVEKCLHKINEVEQLLQTQNSAALRLASNRR